MSSFCLSHFTLIAILISISTLPPLSLSLPKHPFKKLYVFGDSYTDTGNGNSSTGPSIFRHVSSLPYGQTFFHRPTNRYSDGRLFIDFIAEALNLPYTPPYLKKPHDTTNGVNFAVSGCTAIPHPFFVKNNVTSNVIPQSLPTQLTWFKDFIKKTGCNDVVSTPTQCDAVFGNALVWIGEISANDYNYIYGSKITSKTVQKLAIKYQIRFMKEILKMGAKYVVVQGLPATGCFPLSLVALAPPTDRDEMGCVATKNKESYDHNVVLKSKVRSLRREFPEAVIVYGDDWGAYREVYGNPGKYGFTERFKACCGVKDGGYDFSPARTCGAPGTSACGDPGRYVNWDGLHVTEGLNRVTSRLFLDGAFAQPPFPYLLKKAAQA